MKKIFFCIVLLCVSLCGKARITTTSSCDTNNDGEVTVSDVSNTVNKVIGKVAEETQVVTAEQLNTILSEINAKLDKLERLETWAKSISSKIGAMSPEEYEDSITYNGHEYVDLGLTSGTLWATMNVGATTSEDYGDYFAWGETTTKATYYESNYFDSSYSEYCTSGKTELDVEDDAAHMNWGGEWVMPSFTQLTELKAECTWTWTTQNDVNGYKVIGTNGNFIFLPAAGFRYNSLFSAGSYGGYLSRTLYSSGSYAMEHLTFDSNIINAGNGDRYYGRSVRPVINP